MHLQSIKISPDVNEISENIDVMKRISPKWYLESVRQQQQAEIFKAHEKQCEYPNMRWYE
jgi:hypothetical protein